jgi:uncharacterized membrane protein YqjE
MSTNRERSFSDVLDDIVGNIQGIIRSEVRLAKAEIQEETTKAAKAAGALGSGAVLALYAAGFLLLTCLFALEIVVRPWLAALIVTVVVGTAAAILVNHGLKRMRRVEPRPDKTIDTIKENFEWAKNQIR